MFLFKGVIFRFNKLICQGVGKRNTSSNFELVVSTPLTYMSQNGHLPPIFGVKIGTLLSISLLTDTGPTSPSAQLFFFEQKNTPKR